MMSKRRTYKENNHVDEIRKICDFIQTNIGILAKRAPQLKKLHKDSFDITEKPIRRYLTDIRDCVTKTRAKYPGSSYLYSKLPVKTIQAIINEEKMRFDEGLPIDVDALRQLYSWLIQPKTSFDNYDDMFSPQTVSDAHLRDYMLKVLQNAAGDPDPLTQPQVNVAEKDFRQVKKRYLKLFKEDDSTDYKIVIDEYYREKERRKK